MQETLKVLMISTDRNLLSKDSAVSKRMIEYGDLVGELHIVLLSDRSHNLKESQLGKNVWVYPTNSLWKYFRPRTAARLGKKIVLEKKFVRGLSLITTQDPFECGWAGMQVKKKWRIPLEIQLHTDPFSPYFGGYLNKVRGVMAKKTLKFADTVRVVGESVGKKIAMLTSAEIYVLPIYIDKDRILDAQIKFDLHARFGWRFVILAVARLNEEKNLSFALHILALIRQKFKDAGLVILGNGPEKESLIELAKNLGIEKYVAFEGWQEDLASYYKTANIFLQTSLFEGYGVALVEAGLSGLPVVTSPVGVAQELEHNKDAYIYPLDRPDLFAEGILDLLEHNQKRENLKINLKNKLDSILLSKEEYLTKLREAWFKTSKKVSL